VATTYYSLSIHVPTCHSTPPSSYSAQLEVLHRLQRPDLLAMRFSTRNAFYLRASNYRVLPLFLYLDERHVRVGHSPATSAGILADRRRSTGYQIRCFSW
jgi:hypothetical protein